MEALNGRRSPARWLIDWAPVFALSACLWLKLVYASTGPYGDVTAQMDARVNEDSVVHTAALATTALLVGPLCLMRRVPRLFFVLAVSLAISVILLADTLYARRFGDIITVAAASGSDQLQQRETIAGAISLLRPRDFRYFLDIGVALLSMPFYLAASRHRFEESRRARTRVATSFLTLGLLASVPVGRLVWDATARTNGDMFRGELVSIIGVLPYHAFDVLTQFRHAAPRADEPSVAQVRQYLDRHRQTAQGLFGIARGKNLILIQAESLNAFPIGLTVGGQAVAPNLSAFAEESLNFKEFFDQTYGGGTSDGEFTALTSLHPLPEGAVPYRIPYNHFRGLPQILSEAGYATLSASTDWAGSYLKRVMHPSYGFQISFFEKDFDDRERFLWITDRELFRQMLPRLEAQKSPFMAFLITSSNHDPYSIPAKQGPLRLTPDLEHTTLGDYLKAVSYFDQEFGAFLGELRARGLLETSVIVLYGDHTGMFDFPAELPALLGFRVDSGYDWQRALTRLALLMRLPQAQAAGIQGGPSGHLDIAPTVLSLLGVDDDDRVMLGRDLTSPGEAMVVFRDGGFVTDRHLFINRPFTRRVSCYETSSAKGIDCAQLASERAEALEHLRVSDSILRNDLVRDLVRSKPRLTFRDLPAPEAVSSEFGLGTIRIDGPDMYVQASSGATFTVTRRENPLGVMFTPDFVPDAGTNPTDGVTFEVRAGNQRLYQRHVMPAENLDPVVVDLPPMQNSADARISFVTTPGPRGDSAWDFALWRSVQFLVGDRAQARAPSSLATRRSSAPYYSLGFFPLERGQGGSERRWMSSEARIVLPNRNRGMQLRIGGSTPSELAQPPTITLEFNGRRLDQLVGVRGRVQRQYDIPTSMQMDGSDGLSSTLRLTSNRTFSRRELDQRSSDGRSLSFAVEDLSWEPKEAPNTSARR